MNLVIIADAFPPLRTSGAIQVRDLSREFIRQGHAVTLLVPSADQNQPWLLEDYEGIRVLRLKVLRFKDVSYIRRTFAEMCMPFLMFNNLLRSPVPLTLWDGVVWYSPSIFNCFLARALTVSCKCRGYLILRDIFPDWAVDLGLLSRGLPYFFFSTVARYQYSIAHVIGIQSPGNRKYFDGFPFRYDKRLEVLHNWTGPLAVAKCSIQIKHTPIAGRRIFVYAGNMGVAQGVDIFLDLAAKLITRKDIGFLMVGRGTETNRLIQMAQTRHLHNVVFFDEVEPDEIPDLCSQCDIGLLALDKRHKSHNIPGKFLTYMQNGLPVLACVNCGNDLADMIRKEKVGEVCETGQISDLLQSTERLLDGIKSNRSIVERCKCLFEREFSVKNKANQIIEALS